MLLIYHELSDEDLIVLIDAGSESAKASFYERYYIRSENIGAFYANEFKRLAVSQEELTATAYSILPDILKAYKNVTCSFYTYWRIAVRNAIYEYIKEFYLTASHPYKTKVSLDEEVFTNNERMVMHDTIGEEDVFDYDYSSVLDVVEDTIVDEHSVLTNEEKIVAAMLLEEHSIDPKFLMEKYGWDKSHTYYVISRMKKKLAKLLKAVICK